MRERARSLLYHFSERDRVEKKEKTYTPRERTTKSDKSGALTAGTFERRNPVMQIRFSAMIFLLLPRVSQCTFFLFRTHCTLFLHRRGLTTDLENFAYNLRLKYPSTYIYVRLREFTIIYALMLIFATSLLAVREILLRG